MNIRFQFKALVVCLYMVTYPFAQALSIGSYKDHIGHMGLLRLLLIDVLFVPILRHLLMVVISPFFFLFLFFLLIICGWYEDLFYSKNFDQPVNFMRNPFITKN
jgi:hypothetical protein